VNSATVANSQAHYIVSSGWNSPGVSALGTISWALPNVTTAEKLSAYIGATTEGTHTLALPQVALTFATRNQTGAATERMRIGADGSVSIIRSNVTAKKLCIVALRDESDTTVNLVTLTPVGVNCRSFIKVTVKIVSAVSNIANEHVGYALINASTGIAPAGMTVVSGSSIGGFASVGSLSWSGTTLRYTTSTAANSYLTCSIDVELVARDGHVISFP
jgi:hypothetical protein